MLRVGIWFSESGVISGGFRFGVEGEVAGGVEEGDEVGEFFFGEVLEVEALVLEFGDEGEGFEEFFVFGGGWCWFFFGFFLGLLGGGSGGGFGFGLGGDAGDVEDGVGGSSCDFGFFAGVHEVDEFLEGVGDVADGEEFELEGGEMGFEL
jgi:hypothetical protein